ncbi:hypothetical protein BS78_10G218800 [Paspalum vaginatum]|nr:hypothetical protein BS78_10G218800 [Paspalum vaginatum]
MQCKFQSYYLNNDKCSIVFNEARDNETTNSVRRKSNIHKVTFEPKYLGLPTPEGHMKCDKFQSLTDRMIKRCSAWDEQWLSSGAKEVLIKSMAQAIPVYIMSVFQLPPFYWWGKMDGTRKTHWIAWDKFTKSKSEGELGFTDLKLFNQTLLGRQAWRLIERPNTLWARVLKAKYYPNGNLLDTAFPNIQSPTSKAIVHCLEPVKKGVIRPCRLEWVDQFIDKSYITWKENIVSRFFNSNDCEEILNLRLPLHPREDILAWHKENNDVYSVRSAYRLALLL